MVNETKIVVSENEQIVQRKSKLSELRVKGNAYPNDFRRDTLANALHALYDAEDAEGLREENIEVKIAGRVMTCRVMGKASFVHIQDMSGKMQIYIRRDELGDELYEQFLHWDLGDIIGVQGVVFKTKTDELSIRAQKIVFINQVTIANARKVSWFSRS